MAKHFKSKKSLRKTWIIEYVLLFLFSYFLIRLCIYALIIIEPVSYLKIETIGENFLQVLKEETINNPLTLLNYNTQEKEILLPVVSTEEQKEYKKVYIYNTHQTETYATSESVLDASYALQTSLMNYDVLATVEEGDIQEFLTANNYDYRYSYVASRYFIEAELENNDYDLLIDLHRDATSKKNSTVTIGDKEYAKILFVVGKEHDNYQLNYKLAEQLDAFISENYPTLSRGVMLQYGERVNGIYNQDIASNMILLELGGNYNTYEEVKNTIELIAPLIGEFLYGQTI